MAGLSIVLTGSFKDQKSYMLIKFNVSIWPFRAVLLASLLRNLCIQFLPQVWPSMQVFQIPFISWRKLPSFLSFVKFFARKG